MFAEFQRRELSFTILNSWRVLRDYSKEKGVVAPMHVTAKLFQAFLELSKPNLGHRFCMQNKVLALSLA